MRVLLVDDHTILRQALRLVLEMEPDITIVGEAANGTDAVALAHHLQPDIVLMDIGMPIMNGIEATRAIRAEAPGVCVIGLSMFSLDEQGAAIMAAGAVEFVTKSAPSAELIAVLRACAARQREEVRLKAAA